MTSDRFFKWVKNCSIVVLAGAAALVASNSISSCANKSRDLSDRIQKAYDLASGDRVLSRDEEFKLYRDLGITATLHESQDYYLDGSIVDNRVYLRSRNSKLYTDQLPISKLYEYIAQKEKEDFRR